MAIQLRRGLASDLDKSKLLPGEMAIPTTGRPQCCRKAGDVIGMLTTDDAPTMDSLIERMTQLEADLGTLIAQKVGINDTTVSATQSYSSSKIETLISKTLNSKGQCAAGIDYNTVTQTGMYFANLWDTVATNKPVGNKFAWLQVICLQVTGTEKFIQQKMTTLEDGQIYTRYQRYSTGSWSAWIKENDALETTVNDNLPTVKFNQIYADTSLVIPANTWTTIPNLSLSLKAGYCSDIMFSFNQRTSNIGTVYVKIIRDGSVAGMQTQSTSQFVNSNYSWLMQSAASNGSTFTFQVYSPTACNLMFIGAGIKSYKYKS